MILGNCIQISERGLVMLEAVNSVIANAQLVRSSADQVSVAKSYAANPEKTQEVVQAPYISPYIHMDVNHNKAVIQLRESNTGEVKDQFPSERRLEQLRRLEAERNQPKQNPEVTTEEQNTPKTEATVAKTDLVETKSVKTAPAESEVASPVSTTQASTGGDTGGAEGNVGISITV